MSFIEDDDFFSITFSELKHMNAGELQQFSKDTAFKICKLSHNKHNSFEACESKPNEIIDLWVHKLIVIFEGSKFNATEWQQLTDFFWEITQGLTRDTADNKVQWITFTCLLRNVLDLLKWFHQCITHFGATIHCIVLGYALKAVLQFYEILNKSKPDIGFSNVLPDASLLHTFLLQVINESIEVLNVSDAEEFCKLTELINALCSLGEQTPSFAITIIIETSKCITNLTVYALQFSHLVLAKNSTVTFAAWTTRPLSFLIQEIKRKVTLIYKEQTLQQPIEQVEKYLRITNFYIKLLQRLSNDLKHDHFPCPLEFLKTFLFAKSIPKYIQNAAVINNVIEKYVQLDLCDIFRVIYKNKFIKEFLANGIYQNKSEVVSFTKELVQAILNDNHTDFVNENAEGFIKILQQLMEDAHIIFDIALYNEVLVLFASLAILNSTGRVKKHLRSAVLKEDVLRTQVCVDVLLTVARSSHTRPEENLRNFRYWRLCNEKFALLTDNPRELHVGQLLLHYFKLCKSSRCITKSELWDEYDEMHLQKSNYRFFTTLGLSNVLSERSLHSVSETVSSDLFILLNQAQTHMSRDNYYEMIVKIKLLLSRKDFGIKKESLQKVLSLGLKFLNSSPKNELRYFSKFLAIVLEIILCNLNTIEESTVLSISEKFQEQQLHLDNSVLLLLCSVMNVISTKFSQHHKAKQISEAFRVKLHSKSEVEKFLKCFYKLSDLDKFQNCKLHTSLYEQLNAETLLKHNCEKQQMSPESQQIKRIRLEHGDVTNFQLMLKQMHEMSRQLVASELKLDSQDLHAINSIVSNLEHCKSQQ